MDLKNLKTSIRRRFEFIEFQLNWEGTVGRKKLQDQFTISPQQATNDLTAYFSACPGNMIYDPRQKTYVPGPKFRPTLTRGDASEYLMQLDMLHHGYREEGETWTTSVPVFDAVSAHSRRISPKVLKHVLECMRFRSCLKARYISLGSKSAESRTMLPHAIASDGHRWHVRAYDIDKARYSDFVLSRLEQTKPGRQLEQDIPEDTAWSTYVNVILTADPSLDRSKKERLEFEYEMKSGRLRLTVRLAMLFYYLRHYGFDPHETKNGQLSNKSSFLLNIENAEEIEACIGRRS